jgi:hypothetical protein
MSLRWPEHQVSMIFHEFFCYFRLVSAPTTLLYALAANMSRTHILTPSAVNRMPKALKSAQESIYTTMHNHGKPIHSHRSQPSLNIDDAFWELSSFAAQSFLDPETRLVTNDSRIHSSFRFDMPSIWLGAPSDAVSSDLKQMRAYFRASHAALGIQAGDELLSIQGIFIQELLSAFFDQMLGADASTHDQSRFLGQAETFLLDPAFLHHQSIIQHEFNSISVTIRPRIAPEDTLNIRVPLVSRASSSQQCQKPLFSWFHTPIINTSSEKLSSTLVVTHQTCDEAEFSALFSKNAILHPVFASNTTKIIFDLRHLEFKAHASRCALWWASVLLAGVPDQSAGFSLDQRIDAPKDARIQSLVTRMDLKELGVFDEETKVWRVPKTLVTRWLSDDEEIGKLSEKLKPQTLKPWQGKEIVFILGEHGLAAATGNAKFFVRVFQANARVARVCVVVPSSVEGQRVFEESNVLTHVIRDQVGLERFEQNARAMGNSEENSFVLSNF